MINDASLVINVLRYQFFITCAVSLFFLLITDSLSGLWAFFGGMIAFLPNAYLGFRLMKSTKEPKKFLNSFYISEFFKWVLTALLFFLAFKNPNMRLLPLLTSYVSALSIFWFALLMR